MRWVAVGALSLVGVLACSHDWDIVPPGGTGPGPTDPDASGTSSSGSTTSSSGSTSSSSGQPPPLAKTCPADCACGAGETCNFTCTDTCVITCAERATCNVQSNGHACTATAGGATADCSGGNVSCHVIKNGQEMQCR